MSNKPAVKAFLAQAGEPPWPCDYCGELIVALGQAGNSVVHHEDEDRTNNEIGNLRPLHRGCHAAHHRTGKPHSEATKAAISKGMTGVPKTFTPEMKAKISADRKARRFPNRKSPIKREGHDDRS